MADGRYGWYARGVASSAIVLAESLTSRARARNPRWPAAIAALAAGASYAEAARACGRTVATIAKWKRDDDFAQLVHDATAATVADAMQRIRAGTKRASEILLAHMERSEPGWTGGALAARDVLDRAGARAPDAPTVAIQAGAGATVNVAALSDAALVAEHRRLVEEAAAALDAPRVVDAQAEGK